jgi:hypothetical protein
MPALNIYRRPFQFILHVRALRVLRLFQAAMASLANMKSSIVAPHPNVWHLMSHNLESFRAPPA